MDAQPEQRPPLGSWGRLYALVVLGALLVWALLYWLTATFNIPVGAS